MLQSNVTPNTTSNIRKVLDSIAWVTVCDEFIFNFEKIINTGYPVDFTKRNVFKIATMFYDPIGLLLLLAPYFFTSSK